MSSPTSITATTLTTAGMKRSSDDREIRARLLNKLGIVNVGGGGGGGSGNYGGGGVGSSGGSSSQPMTAAQHRRLRILRGMGVSYTIQPSPPDGSAIRPPLDGVTPIQEPLKVGNYNSSDNDDTTLVGGAGDGGDNANKSASQRSKIAFSNAVDVVQIPTRYEYSDRIKSRIWSNRHELRENAERNAVEFASEGWNWRNVTEDEGMYICSVSGELVHPIHLQHLVQDHAAAAAASMPPPVSEETPPPLSSTAAPSGLKRGEPVHGA